MPVQQQIKCINKTNRSSPHERISHIGGDWGKITTAQAISYINLDIYSYFVEVGGVRANVEIAMHNGNPYLKTDRDSTTKDNLLSLRECA